MNTKTEPAGELLPCPFCGGDAECAYECDEDSPDFGGKFVHCKKCDASSTMIFPLMDDVTLQLAEKWNRRVLSFERDDVQKPPNRALKEMWDMGTKNTDPLAGCEK